MYGSQIDKFLTYNAESTGTHVYEHTLQEIYERVKVVALDLTEETFEILMKRSVKKLGKSESVVSCTHVICNIAIQLMNGSEEYLQGVIQS